MTRQPNLSQESGDLARPESPTPQAWRRVFAARELTTLGFVVVLSVLLSVLSPYFLTSQNFQAILSGIAQNAMLAIPMTVLLAMGGFDLSVGAVLALGGAVAGLVLTDGGPVVEAIILGIVAAGVMGGINAALIAWVGINPLIQTLAADNVSRGIVLLILGGVSATNFPRAFNDIGQAVRGGLPIPVWTMLVAVLVFEILLRRTSFFRRAYFIGTNERSARLSGIPVEQFKVFAYTLSGLIAGLTGVLVAARFGTASVTAGEGSALQVIAACIIGGASLTGGQGSVVGSFLGVIVLELIIDGLNLLGIAVYWQPVVTGVVLILAVVTDLATKQSTLSNLLWIRRKPGASSA